MAYRDDLAAARARIDALEHELVSERERADHAEQRAAQAERGAEAARAADPATAVRRRQRRWGRVVYQAPPTYLPMVRLLHEALRQGVPSVSEPETNGLLEWLGYRLIAQPARYLVVAPLLFCVVYPYFALLSLALAPAAAAYVALRGLRMASVGGGREPEPLLDFHGRDAIGMVVTLSVGSAGIVGPVVGIWLAG